MSKLSAKCKVAVDTSSLNAGVISNLTPQQQKNWMDAHLARKDNR